MKTCFEIRNNEVVETSDDRAAILVYVAPDAAEQRRIIEDLRLDAHNVGSALDPDEVPRLEVAQDHVSIIWKRPQRAEVDEQIRLGISSIGFFLRQDSLIILSDSPLPFPGRDFGGVATVTDILLRFLLLTVRHYVSHLKAIKQLSAALESKISSSMENRYLLQMFTLSENLVHYLDAIEANSNVLSKLRSLGGKVGLSDKQTDLLDDIILDNQQCARQAQIYSTVLSGLMDARGTIVNNNMNVLLKNLTVINIIFLPLNFIASIGGMSEFSMITKGIDWKLSYSIFTLGMVLLGWGTYLLVVRGIEKSQARSTLRLRPPS